MTARELKIKLTREWRRQWTGALLSASAGVLLYSFRFGQPLDRLSFDMLALFGAKPPPEEVIIVRMDQAAHQQYQQNSSREWDRGLHARLLTRLTEDKAK